MKGFIGFGLSDRLSALFNLRNFIKIVMHFIYFIDVYHGMFGIETEVFYINISFTGLYKIFPNVMSKIFCC